MRIPCTCTKSMSLAIYPLSYQPDPSLWLEQLKDLPYPLLFDSNDRTMGRYHIITASPEQWLSLTHNGLQASGCDVAHLATTNPSPNACWQAMEQLKGKRTISSDLPFIGGIAGFLSYDFGVWEQLGGPLPQADPLPLFWVGRYHWALVADQQQQSAQLVFGPDCDQHLKKSLIERFQSPLPHPSPAGSTPSLKADTPKQEYEQAIARIHAFIRSGDCYQINYTQRFSTTLDASPDTVALYRKLRQRQSAPFASFITLAQNCSILSLSPERLVAVNAQGQALAQPIKGTIRRGNNAQQDAALARQLETSEKDRAENLMIVDLLRNDLSRVCQPYSVQVPKLFERQSFSSVHHLVSSITGELAANLSPLNALRTCFPGGSITGAPKKRAMEIIQQLEPHPRSVYCGSLFYYGDNQNLDANIAIRTLVLSGKQLCCWAGGGITIDSQADAEYQESLDKVIRLTQNN